MKIALLRALSLAGNLAAFGVLPRALGLSWPGAALVCAGAFAFSWWGTGLRERGAPAPPEILGAARRAAARMEAPPPRAVRVAPGWTAGAFRIGRGYGLLLGEAVEAAHREPVLAHEIAHYLCGDLRWEPFTDGPAGLLLQVSQKVPPFLLFAFPLLLASAPVARATELRADRLAASRYPTYSGVLRKAAGHLGPSRSLLYPSVGARLRQSARFSMEVRRRD